MMSDLGLRIAEVEQAPCQPRYRRYTLEQIEALAHEFIGEPEIDNYERRLLLSIFVQWLARREREGRG